MKRLSRPPPLLRRYPLRILLLVLPLIACGSTHEQDLTVRMTGGDPDAGAALIRSYGCGSCHIVPGVRSARGLTGPPLSDFSRRAYIAGTVPNTPQHLITWIQVPQAIEPGTAMPNMGVTPAHARDIAAYLYSR